VINPAAGAEETSLPAVEGSCPLVHCHTAVGHSKAVLSVFATDSLLFTASKGTHYLSSTSLPELEFADTEVVAVSTEVTKDENIVICCACLLSICSGITQKLISGFQ